MNNNFQSVKIPNSLIILKGFESATNDLVASVLRLTEDGIHPLPGGRLITMNESARIVAVVSKSNDFTLPKIITDYPFSLTTQAYEMDEIVQLVTQQLQMPVDDAKKYYETFAQVSAFISKLPPTERRLGVR
jgi:hypothetical protein